MNTDSFPEQWLVRAYQKRRYKCDKCKEFPSSYDIQHVLNLNLKKGQTLCERKVLKRIYVGRDFFGKALMETGEKFSKPKLFKRQSNAVTVRKPNFAITVSILPR